ncbi:hypothetical protein JTE90_017606 [Oedothorax gibbosus]|uniref:Uncharacterized protein n=1 Tax=Oedothorax gibbosus TaxID=931172 RepID=A0AAV6U4F5_9ARAC|nr:hypothetical protein JTE90_017606 [Oedothorax gibbosus]
MTSPKDSRCFDDSTYTKFGELAYFLLSAFGPLSCMHITECISYVFPSNAASLTGLTREERQKMFLSLPSVILKDGNLQLLEPFPFIKRHVSLTKLLCLFTTSYLAVNGKTHYTILVQKLYQLAPEIAFSNFQNSSNPKWYSYFIKSKLFTMTSKGYLALPFSFFKIAIVIDATSPQEQFGADNSVDAPVKTPNTDGGMKTLPTDDEALCDPPKEDNNLQFPVVSQKCFISTSVSNLKYNYTWNSKSSHATSDPTNFGKSASFDSSKTFNVPKNLNSTVTVPALDVKVIFNDNTKIVSLENDQCIDDSTYKDLGAAVSFLLSVFGPLSCKHVSECISYCFKEIAKLFTEITQKKRKEILSSFPGIELEGSYLKLIKQHEFFVQYLSYDDYLYLFTTSYLALNGKTHYKILLYKLSLIAPDVADHFFEYYGPTWYDHFLRKPKCFVRMPSDHLKLSNYFYQNAKALTFSPALSQVGSCNKEFLNGKDSNNKILSNGTKNMFNQNSVYKVENSEDLNTVPTLNANNIFKLARKGAVFLFKYFNCPFDFNLVFIILHALDIARYNFLLLSKSEQMALVERILALIKTVKSQHTQKEEIPLTMGQCDVLFISYVVAGHYGKLPFKSLIDLFEKHNMDTQVLTKKDGYFHSNNPLFSLDMDLCISLKNFPPAKWMCERLSLPSTGVPDLMVICRTEAACSDAESTEVTDKGTESAKVDDNRTESSDAELIALETFSEYPTSTLANLVDNISNGIDHLLKYFEVNIHSSVLEIILHVTRDQCLNTFLKLTPYQTMKVILLSFSSIYVDAQGMMIPIFTKKSRKTSSKKGMVLCMAYIVSQKGPISSHDLFKEYHERAGITKRWKYTQQLTYFKTRGNIFCVSPNGLVRLTKLPHISLDYVCILQRRLGNSNAKYDSNTKMPCINNNRADENIQPELGVTFSDNIEYKCCVQDLKDDVTVVEKLTLEKEMINRVIGSILYLCNCFYTVEKDDLVYMILGILLDVEAYFLELPLEDKDNFIEKCFFNEYVQHSKDIRDVYSEVVSSPFGTLISDDEKVMLFSRYLLIREKEVHFSHIFNRLQQCNEVAKKSFPTVPKLYNFFSNRKDMFSMNSDGYVKLLFPSKTSNMASDMNKPTFDFKENSFSSFYDFPVAHEEDYGSCLGVHAGNEVYHSNLHLNSVNLRSCDIQGYDGEPSTSKEEVPSLSVKLVHKTENEEPCSLVERDPSITSSICSKLVKNSLKQRKWPSISNFSTKDDIGITQIPTLISNDVPLSKNQNVSDCGPMQKSNCEAHQPKIGRIPVKSRSLIVSKILGKTDSVHQIDTNAPFVATVNQDPTITQEKFSSLEIETDQVLSVPSGNPPEKCAYCCCATSVTKELRTKNFFIVILGQSKDGFPVFDLLEKLLFAAEEVQHYMSCVYKKDILHFIQNHDIFYVSSISGNICLKT